MTTHRHDPNSIPTSGEMIDSRLIRRQIKGPWEGVQDFLTHRDTVMMILLGAVALLLFMPSSFIVLVPLSLAYYAWASSRRYRLPFKTPVTWGGKDYGSPKPDGKNFRTAEGILHFGFDDMTREQLWVENGDARRHGFFLGTTGSGKALPLDTPILTPDGWRANGALRPGDLVCHPDGGTSRILSIHPQGPVPAVRLTFADGREAICSQDHLWHVHGRARAGAAAGQDLPAEGQLMEARDIGILLGLRGDGLRISVPLVRPGEDGCLTGSGRDAFLAEAAQAARDGLAGLSRMPSLVGSAADRLAFLQAWIAAAAPTIDMTDRGLVLRGLAREDALTLKQLAWSLGGLATTFLAEGGRLDLAFRLPDMGSLHPGAEALDLDPEEGLEIVAVDPVDGPIPMSCIRIDRDDGLYVMEQHLVTHNTELLLGVVSQALCWSSGFVFIDGKGTTEFYARAWTLCKRFGREDDLRVLNFTDPGNDPDAPAGGPDTQSNTLNPFAKGSPDQLMNIVVSLMGESGQQNDMWKQRAISLVTAEMMALCELRDSGEILLNVQTVRDFLFLGKGIDPSMCGGRKMTSIEQIPEKAWAEMRTRAGLIELYLRAMNGEFSSATYLALDAFFKTLPAFSLDKALNGQNQDSKCNEQYGYLSMQLTRPLGTLADGYGHIFRTPLGEVDMDDVVLNRRILVVLLPALQKAPEEMQNCGKIIVTLMKMMMGNASGSELQGTKREIIDAKQTRSPSPVIVILDEAGYYFVKGIDVMMAQARSLGFMIVVAGQDMAAMQSINAQIAETAAANASIVAIGKTVDGDKTLSFVQKVTGKTTVSVSTGYSARPGLVENRWMDRMDVSFQEVDKIRLDELQSLQPGSFYFMFDGRLVRARSFFIGDDFGENYSVNKFLKVRGPTDRVPGLDQSVEIAFLEGWLDVTKALANLDPDSEPDPVPPDALVMARNVARAILNNGKNLAKTGKALGLAWSAGLLSTADEGRDAEDGTPEEGEEETEDTWDIDGEDGLGIPELDGLIAHTARHAGDDGAPERRVARQTPHAVGKDLHQALSGRTPRERHGGLVGILASEAAAKAEAVRNRAVQPPAEYPDSRELPRDALGAVFGGLARQMAQMERMMLSDTSSGSLGAEILARATGVMPVPMPEDIGGEGVMHRLEMLERMANEADQA